MLVRWLTKRVEFTVRGQKWPLIFTHRALFVCQDLTGADMLTANLREPSARMLRALLFAALSAGGAECSPDDVGRAINRAGIDSARRTLVEAWTASMAEPDNDKNPLAEDDPSWIEVWAAARQALHLSDDEWLDMTPRQFHALQKRHLQELQREELLACKVEAAIINFSMGRPKEWVTPQSLMLHKLPEPPELPIGDRIMAEMSKFRGLKFPQRTNVG